MLYQTTFEQFQHLAKLRPRIIVSKEIYGDVLTPVRVFQTLAAGREDVVLLDSSDHPTSADACVYIGIDPMASFSSTGDVISLFEEGRERQLKGDAFQALREFFHRNKLDSIHHLAKFSGGMIGFLSYDAVRLFEDIPSRHANEDAVPDMQFKCYRTTIVFDKRTGKVIVTQIVEQSSDLKKDYASALVQIDKIISQLISAHSDASVPLNKEQKSLSVETDIDDEGYKKIVEKAKTYVRKGDAFQVVASRRFRVKFSGDDFNIYRALRVLNPSPYQFYIRNPDFTIVGASPERLVSLQGGVVETMPIAGTRPRGGDFETDQRMESDLMSDEKELAEHMMLVDLGRNDVGSIAAPGTVDVVEKAQVHRYSRVMHIVSRVQGNIRQDFDAFDVLRACFPAGTLSGAPKIRAMEIIDEIETSRRGVYGGAIMAIDNQGQMDGCITIRTAFVKDGVASVRAGAGVVLDSDPQKEADETRHKAQAVLDAIQLAQEGLV